MISDITHHVTHDIMIKVLKYDYINSLLFDFLTLFLELSDILSKILHLFYRNLCPRNSVIF